MLFQLMSLDKLSSEVSYLHLFAEHLASFS